MILTFLASIERKSKKPLIISPTQKDELEIFCSHLQILTRRDKDKTVLVILRAVLSFPPNQPINASLLSKTISLNRITVFHHLNRLEKMGLLKKEKSKYYLKEHGFSKFVLRAKEETDKLFEEVLSIAQKLDQHFYLK